VAIRTASKSLLASKATSLRPSLLALVNSMLPLELLTVSHARPAKTAILLMELILLGITKVRRLLKLVELAITVQPMTSDALNALKAMLVHLVLNSQLNALQVLINLRPDKLPALMLLPVSTHLLELNTQLLFLRDGEPRRLVAKRSTSRSALIRLTLTLEKKTAPLALMGSSVLQALVNRVSGSSHALRDHGARLEFKLSAQLAISAPWSVLFLKQKAAPSALLGTIALQELLIS